MDARQRNAFIEAMQRQKAIKIPEANRTEPVSDENGPIKGCSRTKPTEQ